MTHSTTPNAFNKGLNQVNFRALKSNHLEGYERVAAAPPLATAAIADKLKVCPLLSICVVGFDLIYVRNLTV